jgi:hypothetical protein
VLSVLFLFALTVVCYRRPLPDDFDRYIYEAIVRGETEPISAVYGTVKHENKRAEESLILDNPKHLSELEPFYKIRPLYLELISSLSNFLPIQSAITFISAASFFGLGLVALLWTKNPLLSCLLMAAYPILGLGRAGSPDALAALLAISALWFIYGLRRHPYVALAILVLSLGIRTDNVLILIVVLAWLVRDKKISVTLGGLVGLGAVAIVLGINHYAGTYGWTVLFRLSFIGGGVPSAVSSGLTVREYLTALSRGIFVISSQVSIWLLLGILAWSKDSRERTLLMVMGSAVIAHFLLFPSPEQRYLIWAYIVSGIALINSYAHDASPIIRPAAKSI